MFDSAAIGFNVYNMFAFKFVSPILTNKVPERK